MPRRGWAWATTSCRPPSPPSITCDISGYGDDPLNPGPYRDKKAYDLLIQSEAGFVSVTGTPEEPCKAGPSIADIAAGMYAYTSILAALLQRGQTGKGRASTSRCSNRLPSGPAIRCTTPSTAPPPPPRTGASHATIYPYGPFPTGDGGTVMLGLQNEREWQSFCEKVLQLPDLATDPRFTANFKRVAERGALRQLIVDAFQPLTVAQVVERLELAQIANARVNTMARGVGASAAQGARPLDRVGSPAGRCPRCCRPAHGTRAPHGPGARPGRTHRRYPGRTRLRARGRSLHAAEAV